MNLARIARELEIDESEYIALLRLFQRHTTEDLETLKRAEADSQLDAVYRAAHSIKGASATLCLWPIHDAASEICTDVNEGISKTIGLRVADIEAELSSLVRLLDGNEGETADGA